LGKKIQQNMKNNPTNENFEKKKKSKKFQKLLKTNFFSHSFLRRIMMKKYFMDT
jgi:hypothetical protein